MTHKPYSISGARAVKVPGSGVQVLTVTSKMPGPSYSLPARRACPNAQGSVCERCYADKGCYVWRSTVHAQMTRFAWTVESMKSEEGRTEWVRVIVEAIRRSGTRYFRIHDSGDFFSVEYVRAWQEVCRAMPKVKFWAPTQEYQSKASTEFLPVINPRVEALRKLAALPNCTIRPSALNIGDYAPQVLGLHAGSAVGQSDALRTFQCPAMGQGGECRDCRTCWEEKTLPVSYHLH
jgi:hypothetical protein